MVKVEALERESTIFLLLECNGELMRMRVENLLQWCCGFKLPTFLVYLRALMVSYEAIKALKLAWKVGGLDPQPL